MERPAQDWIDSSLGALVDHVVSHFHARERAALPLLLQSAKSIRSSELVTLSGLVSDFVAELLAHIWKEESVLFPYLRQLDSASPIPEPAFGSVRNPIGVMLRDHERSLEHAERMRRAGAGFAAQINVSAEDRAFSTLVERVCSDLAEHLRFESEVLFPRAMEMEQRRR